MNLGVNEWTLVLTAVSLVVITSTFVVYFFQLLAMRSASRGQNILALVNFLQTTEVRDARHLVRNALAGKTFDQWSEEEKQIASLVCGSYDVAEILIKHKVVEADPFVENWGPSIVHCHGILKPLIAERRSQPHNGPKYWDDFDDLAARVLKKK